MNNKYEWDLDAILEGNTFDDLYSEWLKQKDAIIKLYKNFVDSEENFIEFKKESLIFTKISNRVSNYLSNNINEDLTNSHFNGLMQKLMMDANDLSVILSDLDNVIIKNKEKVQTYLKNPLLSDFVTYYQDLFDNEHRILSSETEEVLSKISLASNAVEDVFSTLTDNDITFKDALDSKGKPHKIDNIGKVSVYLKHKDRELRKNTWINFNKAFYNFRATLTKTLYYNYLELNVWSQVRKYKNYIESACDSDDVPVSLIEELYSNIYSFRDAYKRYVKCNAKHLKKLLKLDKIEPWDSSMDLSKNTVKYSQEQAKNEVIEALKPLGVDYLKYVKEAFDERWISWMPKKGKQTGAYSIGGTYGLKKKYISMNFDGTMNSVSTLAHELGHSVHSCYFGNKQTNHCSCKIFYAEIASIVNEILLNKYWLKTANKEKKKMIYSNLLSDFFSTTTRQIIFSNFEYEALKLIDNKLPFTTESLQKIYVELCEKYTSFKPKKKEPYTFSSTTILRISHFYVGNFYVYKYAIGMLCAIFVAEKILNGDKEMINKYYAFLESGSSKKPLETIAILGIDLTDREFYSYIKKTVESWVKEFEQTTK